jgi:hypothetical protein
LYENLQLIFKIEIDLAGKGGGRVEEEIQEDAEIAVSEVVR